MSESEDTGYAEAWRPEPGDKIAGRVLAIAMGPDMGYGPYPIVTLDSAGTEYAIHAFHQILRTELARRRPKVGDEIEVTYQGKRSPKSGNGNPFHVYRVIGGREPEFNWESELPPEERARAQAEVPIAPAPVPSDLGGPLERQPVPSAAEKAEQFGDEVPF